jgi:hypothetical protein
VDSEDGLVRLGGDGTVHTVYPGLTAGLEGDLTTAAGVVLLRASDGTISPIDAASGRLLERITPLTAGSMIAAYGSVWLTSNDDGTLTRLRAWAPPA